MLISTKGNKLYLIGNIFGSDEIIFEHHFVKIEASHNTVEVFLHTNGGDVFSGNYMQNRLKSSSLKVIMNVTGTAFSMGSVIMLSGDEINIARNGWVMVHGSSGSGGTVSEQQEMIKVQEGINENFTKDLMAVTGKSQEVVTDWLSKDTYFSAEQALKAKLVHNIVEPFVTLNTIDAQSSYLKFTALLTADKSKQNINTHTMKQPLITALGLTSVTAESSDTAIIGAVQAHYEAKNTVLQSQLDVEKSAHTALKTIVDAQKTASIDAFLEPLKKTHKEAQITAYKNIAETSGLDVLKTVLGSSSRNPVAEIIVEGGDPTIQAKKGWNWDKYQKEDQTGLEALQKNNIEAFKQIYKAKFGKEFIAN